MRRSQREHAGYLERDGDSMYTLTRAEQEIVIVWDAESRTATIDTADPVTIRKLDRLAEQYPEEYRLVSEDVLYNAKRYEVPAKYIRFGKPASDAQREAAKRKVAHLRRENTHTSDAS